MKEYVKILMEKLFTVHELSRGYILDKITIRTKKQQLSTLRVGLLKEALFKKFKIASDDQLFIWREMKMFANRICDKYAKQNPQTDKFYNFEFTLD